MQKLRITPFLIVLLGLALQSGAQSAEEGSCPAFPPEIVETTEAPRFSIRPWTGGRIPYRFDDEIAEPERERFRAAMDEYERKTALDFVPRTDEELYLRIARSSFANQASLGMSDADDSGTGGLLRISRIATHRTLLHELGHTIGRIHEHQRPDRSRYVEIYPERASENFRLTLRNTIDAVLFVPYDFRSVMHYRTNAFAADPNVPTIVPHPEYAELQEVMGNVDSLSAGDVAWTEALYSDRPQKMWIADRDARELTLRFSTVHQATRHRIQIATDPDFACVVAERVLKMPDDALHHVFLLEHELDGLTPLTTYFVRVRGEASSHELPWSASVRAGTMPAGPEADWVFEPVPNPATGRAHIRIESSGNEASSVQIVDVMGRQVAKLHEGTLPRGTHRLEWDTGSVAPGLYFIVFHSGAVTRVRQLVTVR